MTQPTTTKKCGVAEGFVSTPQFPCQNRPSKKKNQEQTQKVHYGPRKQEANLHKECAIRGGKTRLFLLYSAPANWQTTGTEAAEELGILVKGSPFTS